MPKKIEGQTTRTVTQTTFEQGPQPGQDPLEISQASPQNEAFFELMENIPPADWENKHISVVVYRREPPLDPQRPDRPGYAFKKTEAFDEGFVAACYGGGVYEYWYKEAGKLIHRGHFVIGGAPKAAAKWGSGPAPSAVADAQPGATAEKGSELIALVKDLQQQISSGASIEQMKKTFDNAQDLMRETYAASLKSMAERNPEGDMLDRMIKLGLIKTGGEGGLVETIALLKELGLIGGQKEDLFEQLEKFETIGKMFGWTRGGDGGDDDWRVAALNRGPEILAGLERVTLNIVNAIAQAKGQPGTALQPAQAQPAATQKTQQPQGANAQPPGNIPPETQQAALDAFIKTRLVDFFQRRAGAVPEGEEATAEDVVNWLEWTAPDMVTYLSKFDAKLVTQQISGDAILRAIAQDPEGPRWIEELLKEMKSEPVEA